MLPMLKFAIVGTGVIAHFHAKALSHLKGGELVAVADNQVEVAREFAESYGIASVYSDYEEMLKREDIDSICVCTPSGLHGEVVIAAAQAGKHVFCEKPLEITSEKMQRMIDTCRENKVKLACVFQRRVMPASIIVKKAVQEGRLGKPLLGDAYLKYYRSPEYYRSAGWRGTWQLDGGGALMNQGVHGIDVIQWLMGDVQSVFAYAAPLVREIEVEDTAVAVLKYKSGAFGVIQGTTSVYPGLETRFELHGDKGSIIFADSGIKQWSFLGSDEPIPQVEGRKNSSSDPTQIASDGHYVLLEDFVEAIHLDRDPLVTGEEAKRSVDLILSIYESARTGQEVQVGSL
jgi:UDP-N-acetyl-2-amino-2-deoxyglucuronate dehydrogenase